MSTRRPPDWPVYGDPVRCPISSSRCDRFACVMHGNCERRDAMALEPMENESHAKGGG